MNGIALNLIALYAAFAAAGQPAAGLRVELATLAGSRQTGTLLELGGDHAAIHTGKADVKVPLSEVLELRVVRPKAALSPDLRRPELTLTDGSRIYWTALRVEGQQVDVETPHLGKFAFPLTAVASIRLATADAQVADAWKDLAARDSAQDMLVSREGNSLDHLDGTVGAIDATQIRFVIDGEENVVKRAKVFGVIYSRKNAEAGKPVCEVSTLSGDFLKSQTAVWNAGSLTVGLLGGAQVSVPDEQLVSLDYSLGKVRYLSQLDPRSVEYTPYFDQVWTYWRDRTRDGAALRLGNKDYARGLWIHSRTLLKYRLNAEYRRFQAVMGIDDAAASLGNVHVVISGDGKKLVEADVARSDAPRNLDLDVGGVRELSILVDFGADNLDIGDHLDLADARLIK
jgi:NPCBM/NEW2 domain